MLEARGQLGQFGLRHRSHLGVGVRGHGLGLFDSVGDLLVFAELFNGLFEVAMGFGDFVDGFAVVLNFGEGHLVAQIHVAVFHLLQSVKHGVLSSLWLRSRIEARDRAGCCQ